MKKKRKRKIKFVLDDDVYVYTKSQLKRTKEYWEKHSKWKCKWCGKKFRAQILGGAGWTDIGPCCIKCYKKKCEVKRKAKRKIKFVLD